LVPTSDWSDDDWISYLSKRHDAEMEELEDLNTYYEGRQPLTYMHPEVFREVSDRIAPVIVNWPLVVVGAVEERLDVEGFRLPDEDGDEVDLWADWQANDMDEQSQLGIVDALVMRRSYTAVGTNEDDPDSPLITAESPLEMFADPDPRTRKVRAALRRVQVPATFARETERIATLYRPNATVWLDWKDGSWKVVDRDDHNLGVVPVVPLVNRGRLSIGRKSDKFSRIGQSELDPVIPLSDAACKQATDMMIAAEFVALPLRGLLDVSPEDLTDAAGNQLTAVQMLMKKLLLIPNADGAKPFDFPAASLANFHDSISSLARLVASIAGLPPDYMGLSTENPPSAESRLAGEIRLVKRAERKQRAFGGSYEQVMRLVDRFKTGDWDPKLKQLETRWRDASTPTVAQSSDAAVKKRQAGIISNRQAQMDLGYTDATIRRMTAELEEEADREPLGQIARTMADDRTGPGAEPPAA
jgi:hypothetical protein